LGKTGGRGPRVSAGPLSLLLAVGASLAAGARAPSLAEDDKGGIAPVGSAVPARPRLEDVISPEERRRAAEVANPTGAFRPEGVWLPPLYLATADRSVEWVGLLYLQVTDFEAGTRTRVLPPFFLSRADADTRTVISPLYGRREDLEGAAGFIGAYTWRRDRLADSDVVFPFFWSFRERDFEDGPIVRSSGAVAPFAFWQRDTSGKHRTFAPPLLWRWGDANETTTILGNLYWHEEPGKKTRALFPLYFGGTKEDGSSYDVVPPLLAFRSTEGERTTLLALNTVYASRPQGYTLASVPFVFAGRDGLDSYACVPPLIFFRAGDGTSESTLVGNTFWSSGPDRWSFAFAPLVFAWGNAGSSSWIAGPAFHHADDTGSASGVLPLYLGGTKGEESWDALPPLLAWHSSGPDRSSLVAFPWLWRFAEKDASTTVVGPVFHHEDASGSDTGVLPFYFGGVHGERSYDVLPPLLAWHTADGERSTTVSLPFFWHRAAPGAWDTGVLPFWLGGEREDRRYDVLPALLAGRVRDGDDVTTLALPWVWDFAGKDRRTTVVGPVYHHSDPTGADTGLLPLYLGGHHGDRSYDVVPPALFFHAAREGGATTVALPWLWRSSDGDSSTTVAGPVYHHEDASGSDSGILPLGVWGEHGENGYLVLPGLLTARFTRPGGSTYATLPLFWRSTDQDSTNTGVLPFWFGGEDKDGRYDVIPPLLAWRTTAKDRSDLVALPWLWSFDRGDSKTTVAGPYYHHTEPGSSMTGIVPLWFSGTDEAQESRYDALPALLTWHGSSPGRSTFASVPLLTYHHEEEGVSKTLAANTWVSLRPDGWSFAFAPLVWAGGDAEESHFVGFPLLWKFSSPGSERLAFLPFFDWAENAERTHLVSPVFFHSEDHQDDGSATVVLGLGWWLHEKQRDERVIFPVWWDFEDRDAGTELRTAFPIYWSWRRGTETTSVLLNTAWTSGETEKGAAWSVHVFPLADVSSDEPSHLHWQVLGGLFGHESRGDAARWRLLWQWTDGG